MPIPALVLAVTTEDGGLVGAIGLNRIEAQYLVRNPASSRVMEKLGMTHEGIHRQYIVKWDMPEDIGVYAMLSSER